MYRPGSKVPCGESCMWGDYHLMELGVYLQRLARNGLYHKYFIGEQRNLPLYSIESAAYPLERK